MSRKEQKSAKKKVDETLFDLIQPKGGITFKDASFVRMGDGYVRCLHIYELPNSLSQFWLTRVFTVSNSICSFDVSTKDMNEVKKNINRSISEENARAVSSKTYLEYYDAEKRKQELQSLFDELSRMWQMTLMPR